MQISTFPSSLQEALDASVSLSMELNLSSGTEALSHRAEEGRLSSADHTCVQNLSPEENFIIVVISQAVTEWRSAMDTLRETPGDSTADSDRRKVEHFLRFGWFHQLIDLDGEALLARLREEYRDPPVRPDPAGALLRRRLKNLNRSVTRKRV